MTWGRCGSLLLHRKGLYARYYLEPFKAAAASLGVEPIVAPVRDVVELKSVIAAHAREPNGGLIVMPDAFNDSHREDITSLAAPSTPCRSPGASHMSSGFAPRADIVAACRHVRFVPTPDITPSPE
jgi:hypothetical protein